MTNHPTTDACLGCIVCKRLQETDQEKVDLIHDLTRNMLDLQRICYEADEIEFEVMDELIESTIEDVISESLGVQPPSTATHH